jgi:hypothetical protein
VLRITKIMVTHLSPLVKHDHSPTIPQQYAGPRSIKFVYASALYVRLFN